MFKKIIKNHLLTTSGKLKTSYIRNNFSYFKKTQPELYEYIINTKIFEETKSITTTLSMYYNDIEKVPLCKNCGKKLKYYTFKKPFKDYCSHYCGCRNNNTNYESFLKKSKEGKKEKIQEINDWLLTHKKSLVFDFDDQLKNINQENIQTLITTNKIIKNFDFFNEVILRTKKLLPIPLHIEKVNELKISERLHILKNELNEIPLCPFCKKERRVFYNFNKGYHAHCFYPNCKAEFKKKRKIESTEKKIFKKIKNTDYKFEDKEFKGRLQKHRVKCKICDTVFDYRFLNGSHFNLCCPKCFPFNGKSKGEYEIKKFIESMRFVTKHSYRIYIEGRHFREIDLLIKEKSIGIEYNGLFFHSEASGNKDKNYHLNKTNLCNEQLNAQLLHIFDSEWILKKDIVKSIIASKLGIYKQRYYARKCKVKEIDAKTKNGFLDKNHLQGKDRSSVKLGLYHDNDLLAVMTFGKRQITGKKSFELIRFATKLNTQVVGGASKLFKYFLRNCWEGQEITTYADRRYSDGTFYEKLGFKLSHCSKPNYWYTQDYLHLEHRVKYQKHKLINILKEYDPELTEWENMQINGYDRIWDCGNYVFTYK